MAGASGSGGPSRTDCGNAPAIYLQTSADLPITETSSPIRNQSVGRNDQTNRGLTPSRCAGSPRPTLSGTQFFIDDVSNKKERWKRQANIQSQEVEPIHSTQAIQTDISLPNSSFSSGDGLDGKNRSVISVFSRKRHREPSTVPETCVQRASSPDDVSSLWSVVRTQDLLLPDELGSPTSPFPRNADHRVFGRLSNSLPVGKTVTITGTNSPEHSRVTGVDHQLRKVCDQACTGNRVSRVDLEHETEFQGPPTEENAGDTTLLKTSHVQEEDVVEGDSNIVRHSKLCQFCRVKRAPALPSPTAVFKGSSQTTDTETSTAASFCSRRSTVVDCSPRNISSEKQLVPEVNPAFSNNRCIRLRVGGTAGRHDGVRQMATRAATLALQQEGTVCHHSRNEAFQIPITESPCDGAIGQSHSRFIYTERRWDAIRSPIRANLPASGLARQMEYIDICGVHSRQVQRYCGQTVARESSIRMAPSSTSCKEDISSGWYTTDRSLCKQGDQSCRKLCDERQLGPVSPILQCIQPTVAVSIGVDIPSTESHSAHPESLKLSRGSVFTGGSNVEESILVTRSASTGTTQTDENSTARPGTDRSEHRPTASSSTRHGTLCLENWGWEDVTKEWSDAEISLLRSSWRESTLKTYHPAWQRWIRWCSSNNFNFKHPNGVSLSKFLAHLFLVEKLAYSTILLHKSVVLTFGQPSNNENLNSNFLVKHILKAISLRKPRLEKSPIWDPSELVDWLQTNTPNCDSLFAASRRLACILLLASGRRVHDLTLLKVSPEYYIDNGNHCILHPSFGSKTDTCSYRQSGWKLLKHNNSNICPIYWLRKVISLGAERRTAECNNSLFISIRGPNQGASRTIIGNWVKSVLKDAGISASPGSVRSAVASLNWYENFPVEEILARGNWRRENTFAKYYQKQIIGKTGPSESNLSVHFEPVL